MTGPIFSDASAKNRATSKFAFICLMLSCMACLSSINLGSQNPPVKPTRTPQSGLEIINASNVDVCFVLIASSQAEFWGSNLIREPLEPGDAFLYDNFRVGEFDFLAEDCAENEADIEIVDEVYEVELGQEFIVWRIGESVSTAEGPTVTAVEPTPEPVEPPEIIVSEASFQIVNISEQTVCNIRIATSASQQFGPNQVIEPLAIGGSLQPTITEPTYYDVEVYDCDGDLHDERRYLYLGQDDVTYFIGSSVQIDGGSAAQKAYEYQPIFEPRECMFDVPDSLLFECGVLIVPEERSLPTSPKIELAVAILRPPSGNTLPDPIVHLAGGPGQSMIDIMADDPEFFSFEAYAPNREQIFIDQRGSGYSIPTLNCPEVEDANDEDIPYYDALEACRERLTEEGINLAAYNTAANAHDIHDVTVALGYEQVNLYGVSYGTRLALAVMRDHPQNVRSVVLDSVFPPNANVLLEDTLSAYLALARVFDACAADAACSVAYPDLEAVFLQVVTDFNANPVTIEFEDRTGFYEQAVTGDDVVNTLVGALFSASETLAYTPRAIYGLRDSDYTAFQELDYYAYGGYSLRRQLFSQEDYSDSEGMFNSVTCQDEYAFEDYTAAERVVQAAMPEELHQALFYDVARGQYRECLIWGSGKALNIENQAVTSNIPTLLISGSFDPVTPPSQAKLAHETLSRAYYVEFPYQGHSVTGFSLCATDIMAAFVNNPLSQPESSCVDQEPVPRFLLPNDRIPRF